MSLFNLLSTRKLKTDRQRLKLSFWVSGKKIQWTTYFPTTHSRGVGRLLCCKEEAAKLDLLCRLSGLYSRYKGDKVEETNRVLITFTRPPNYEIIQCSNYHNKHNQILRINNMISMRFYLFIHRLRISSTSGRKELSACVSVGWR